MKRIRTTFASLNSYNFRLFFAAQSISVTGTWMQKIGQVWLVLELTGSGTLLGVTAALQHVPTILVGPWGGLLADRIDKRKLLLWTQAAAGVVALLLGVLVALDRVELWMVLVLALALGTINSIERPARNTFVLELVGPGLLTNAITLNNVVMNIGKVVGPAIAGIAIAGIGLSSSFLLNAASYGAVIVGLFIMRTSEISSAPSTARSAGQLREGVQYVRQKPELLALLVMMGVSGLLAWEWAVTLPLFAHDTFRGDAHTLALMFSALGGGSVVGGLLIAGSIRATPGAVITAAGLFGVTILGAAAAPTLSIALGALFVLGGMGISLRAVASSFIQLNSAPQMQGRVMSLLIVAFQGTSSVGGPLIGWVGDAFGARAALGLGGVATLMAATGAFFHLRRKGYMGALARSRDSEHRVPRPAVVTLEVEDQ